jgi:hypothetical protein
MGCGIAIAPEKKRRLSAPERECRTDLIRVLIADDHALFREGL